MNPPIALDRLAYRNPTPPAWMRLRDNLVLPLKFARPFRAEFRS